MPEPLLEVKDLFVEFHTDEGVAKAINGVNLALEAGETLAILGESGSGKSVTAQAIMGILDMPPAKIPGGQILYEGRDLLTMPDVTVWPTLKGLPMASTASPTCN